MSAYLTLVLGAAVPYLREVVIVAGANSAVSCVCHSIIVALGSAVFVVVLDSSVVTTAVDSAAAVVGR